MKTPLSSPLWMAFGRLCRCSLCVLICTFPLCAPALSFRYGTHFLMMNATLHHQNVARQLEVGLSTGMSHCLLDSTYVVDSLGVDISQLKASTINGEKRGCGVLLLDSLDFCGDTYRNVWCLVMETKTRLKGKMPPVVIGNNVLGGKAWHVDLQRQTFTPCSPKLHYSKTRLKWKTGSTYESTMMFLKAKVGGRKVLLQFTMDLGKNILPHGIYPFPSTALTKEGGSLQRGVSEETVPVYEGVTAEIGDFRFTTDYVLGFPGDETGALRATAFGERSFVLNYKKKLIEILE